MGSASLPQAKALADLAKVLYNLLPASFAPYTWEDAANEVGLSEAWHGGSKLPALQDLVEAAYESAKLAELLQAGLREGVKYRSRRGPALTRRELLEITRCSRTLDVDVPGLGELIAEAPACLSSKAIGAVRRVFESRFSRAAMKQLLLDAGADSGRVLKIPVVGNIKSKEYLSKATIISKGFDTIYEDFDKEEADGVVLELVRQMHARSSDLFRDERDADVDALADALAAEGIELAELLEPAAQASVGRVAVEQMQELGLNEARELGLKALRRLRTDPSGAVTAAVSAAESVGKAALQRLDLRLPGKATLSKVLVAIRKETNFEEVFGSGEKAKRVVTSLSSLTENLYLLSHEAGARHGPGEGQHGTEEPLAELIVSCCSTISFAIMGAMRRGLLKGRSGQGK